MKRTAFFILIFLAMSLVSCKHRETSVLVLYENSGHHKPFTDAVLPWLREAAPAEHLRLTEIQNPGPIDAGYLSGFDVVLQLDYPPYMWSDEAKEAFQTYIDEGLGGWVGLHHASLLGEFDGYAMWEWFSDLLGGIRYRDYIAELSDGRVILERRDHPVFDGVPDDFVIPDDEWYIYDHTPRLSPFITVLATVDEDSYTVDTDKKSGDHPVIWSNTSKGARNIYFQFGHSPKLAGDPVFRTLILNALHWASEK